MRTWKSTCLFLIVTLVGCTRLGAAKTISGVVLGDAGAVPGAVVRVQATANHTTADGEGRFMLEGLGTEKPVTITAWAPGYYIVGEEASPGDSGVEIHLHPHTSEDNPAYEWLPSQYHPGQGEDQGCAACHSRVGTDLDFDLPVDEWVLDAHSQAATNPRFLTMYTGTDVGGNKSPDTRFATNRDYGRFPLRPDPNEPYYGPGYKLDFPDTAGNCAACHTPAASVNNPYGVDPTSVSGVPAEGVPCDFCHKIWDVRLDASTGLPFANMPGVLSFAFRRPPADHQFFAGPLDDVAPGEDTYSPLQQQSQICAPCHFGVFWDTVVYNSFGEWLGSPYSDPDTGQVCQDCHMPPQGATHFARPDQGGLERGPSTIFSHRMPGAGDVELLQNAVDMDMAAEIQDGQVVVTVTITNDKTGHHVPTDSPLRHMILRVAVTDTNGNPLLQVDGPTIPEWVDIGDPEKGYLAQLPGTAYAKILEELWTEVTPTGAYWVPTRITQDNRIPAFGRDVTSYVFQTSGTAGPAVIEVHATLVFRRAFIILMDQKGWDVADITMEEQHLTLSMDG